MTGPATAVEATLRNGKRQRQGPATSPSNDRVIGAPSSLLLAGPLALAEQTDGHGTDAEPRSRLPGLLRFPLVVVLSFAISALAYTGLDAWAGMELAAVMRQVSGAEVAAWAGWRLLELALGWAANFDRHDMLCLSLLSQSPAAYLLHAFYNVRPQTAVACLLVDVMASYAPFGLLRRPATGAHQQPALDIAGDWTVAFATSFLGAAVYSISMFAAGWCSLLPHVLVLYFNGVPTVERAAGARWPGENPLALQVVALLSGPAVWRFVFAPAVTAATAAAAAAADTRAGAERGQPPKFDPASATLGETLRWNVWTGYAPSTRTAAVRTAVLAAAVLGRTALTGLAIEGVEPFGAAAYGGIWAMTAAAAGLGMTFVGSGC